MTVSKPDLPTPREGGRRPLHRFLAADGSLTWPPVAVQRPARPATALYRFYDGAAELLYVGVTCNPVSRFQQHQERSDWWSRASLLHAEWHDTRELAEAAEERAVNDEAPEANRKMNGRQYRYALPRFHATQLHPIARAHFEDRPFSFPDLVAELGIPFSTATRYGNRLVAEGKFLKLGRWTGPTGRTRTHYRAAPVVAQGG